MKAYIHKKFCTGMLIAALFIIAPKYKPLKCPSAGCIHGLLQWKETNCWHTQCSRLKNPNTHCVFPLMWSYRTGKIDPLKSDCGPWVAAGGAQLGGSTGFCLGCEGPIPCTQSWAHTSVYNWQNSWNQRTKEPCVSVCKLHPPKIFFKTSPHF